MCYFVQLVFLTVLLTPIAVIDGRRASTMGAVRG